MGKKSAVINDVFDRLKAAIDVVEDMIPGGCAKSAWAGVITSCPTNIGTGMRASVHVQLPKLCADGTEKKPRKSVIPSVSPSEVSVVNTPPSVLTVPSISLPELDSVSLKPKLLVLYTRVSRTSGKLNKRPKCCSS